jgi:hypothetical protein
MSERSDLDPTGMDGPTADPGTDWMLAAQQHYDPDEHRDLTTALVFTIAEAAGVAPRDLTSPPLYHSTDAAALEETFFGPDADGGTRKGTGTVSFRYTDYLVTVRSDGWVQVFEETEPETPD